MSCCCTRIHTASSRALALAEVFMEMVRNASKDMRSADQASTGVLRPDAKP